MKILQLNITSLQTSRNQLKFYQEQNDYNIIALQETNVKDKLEIFNYSKRKFHSTFSEKEIGFSVALLIKNDIKDVFFNNMQSNIEAIWNLVEITQKQTLMDNVYIPQSDSEMLFKFELALGKHYAIPLLQLGDFNAKYPIRNINCKASIIKTLDDIMSRHNV